MNRKFIFVFTLLAILSMVNAIPHQLQKRATTFIPCPNENPLTVSVTPDPLVPGKTATYTVAGKFAKAAPKGSGLVVAFFNSGTGKLVPAGDPFIVDICAKAPCPANSIETVEQVPVPAGLSKSYVNIVG